MKPKFKSILSRIIWLHALALGIAAVAMPLATYLLLSTTANDFETRTLQDHAEKIARYLQLAPDGQWRFALPRDLQTFYQRGYDGFAFSIVDNSGRVLFSSLRERPSNLAGGQLAESPSYFHRNNAGAVYYGASVPVVRSGKVALIKIGQNLEHPDVILDDIVTGFLIRVAWFTFPIMLLLLITDILIVRRALGPVARVSQRAGAIDPSRIDLRLPTEGVPREILPLVVAVNQALDRLERGFRLQRDFTADAAHELRTPLAILRARVDSLEDHDGVRELRSDVELMTRIVNQLLEVAELESTNIDLTELVDLGLVCREVMSSRVSIARSNGRNIVFTGRDGSFLVRGNSLMLKQAIANVVDNAVRHTPENTTVQISLNETGIVTVSDQGQGISPNERDEIFRRFWRRDRSRTDGSGLGLAIVARIVKMHNGSIDVQNQPSGGAIFSMRFGGQGAESPA